MKILLQTLQGLRAEPEVIRRSPFASLVDVHRQCPGLFLAAEKLRRKAETIPTQHTHLDAERVWTLWEAAGFDPSALDGLAFRTLCCCEDTALRPRFVQEIARKPERLKNSRCLYGLVNVYFSYWREMEQPVEIERLIVSALNLYPNRNGVVRAWRGDTWLFTERAADEIARMIVTEMGSVGDTLKKHHVGTGTKLAFLVRAKTASESAKYFRASEGKADDKWSLNYFQWMTKEVISDITLAAPFYAAISALILSQSAARSQEFQRAIRAYVQGNRRLGDPRLRESATNWQAMDPEASRLYLSWLARDNIIFFFNTILPDNNENRRRKEFWLRYHRKIRDFQVAVSEGDAWKIQANKNASGLLYSRVTHQTTSAFLMEFESRSKSYVVVEFSEVGHASYIYAKSDFAATGITLRTARFELTKHLKTPKRIARILHLGRWENTASYMLSSELGLTP